MKEYVLNYYPKFSCVAQKCKHTCCAGWDMYIDEETLDYYKKCQSFYSENLFRGINFKKSKFKSDKRGRCAFLNSDGLCEIIINIGEKSLCQVCRDHPRFRSFFDDRIEMGLGFCCEESTRIILFYDGKIEPTLVRDDGKQEELSFIQANVLKFRQKALDIVQNRDASINERIDDLLLLCNAQITQKDFFKILKAFISFERLDKSWSVRLAKLKTKSFDLKTDESLSVYCEQFLVNSIFRHLSDAEDTAWVRARMLACICSWWMIKSIFENEYFDNNSFEIICDIVRQYSSEVEYSQENLNKFFCFANKFIKI